MSKGAGRRAGQHDVNMAFAPSDIRASSRSGTVRRADSRRFCGNFRQFFCRSRFGAPGGGTYGFGRLKEKRKPDAMFRFLIFYGAQDYYNIPLTGPTVGLE